MTVDTNELYFILDNTPPEQNIMLSGRHGIGKSRILEDYFSKKGQKVVTLFLGQMSDPGDLIGLPSLNQKTGKTEFMLPYWFPLDEEPVVLFLDELNRARPEVLQTIMDLTLNRKLAGKSLPKGSRIISAVNSGSEYQLTDLDPALVSRFNIYEFSPSVLDWINWAENSGIDARIINFINQHPEYLDGETVSLSGLDLEKTPDRRGWERVSKIIYGKPLSNNFKVLVSGIIGTESAGIFFESLENTVVSPSEILCSSEKLNNELLKNYSIPQMTSLNENILRFIETQIKNEKSVNAENLKDYIQFLLEEKKEVLSHFISLLNARDFPLTLNFILENCGNLHSVLMDFVSGK